jgi:glycosyltransferase involved in cell wall biosynthesis
MVQIGKIEKDHLNILYAGRLIAFKNLPALIDAFVLTEKKGWPKKLILDIAGEGPIRPALAAKIDAGGLADRVRLLPKLSHAETLAKIAASDALAMVSLTEVNSNAVIEALALSRPVILSKASEEYHIGSKHRLIHYADPLDIDDIAEKIEAALKDGLAGSPAERIGAGGTRDDVVSWGDKEVVDRHLKMFEALLKTDR